MSDNELPTPRALRACTEWLCKCLELGWPKSSLDDLEKLWWKWHDRYGKLIASIARAH
jgi:hypothetical protein